MNYFKITILFTSILFMANCNPKEEIAPENPCEGQEEVKADFVIEEGQFDKSFPAGASVVCCYCVAHLCHYQP